MSNVVNQGGADGFPWTAPVKLPIRDGGQYPSAPPGYSESTGPGATYAAFRFGSALFIHAAGTIGHTNQVLDIRQSPLRIYPPQFNLLVYTPEIILPATRKFSFTVVVGYPPGLETVTMVDAQGRHAVNILTLGKGFRKAEGVLPTNEGYGVGDTFDEAVNTAVANVSDTSDSTTADEFVNFQVVESGKITGGFVGVNLFYARVTRLS